MEGVIAEGCQSVNDEEVYSEDDEECHPLMNAVVLRNLFQYCSVKDLKNLRLVCPLWYELASPYLQLKSQVALQEDLFREGTSIKSFLLYIDSLSPDDTIFFRNFKINLLTVDKNVVRFWERIGPSMHSLEMSWCRFMGTQILRNVMFKWTPNLKHFRLRDCTFFKDLTDSYIVENELAETNYSVQVNRNMTSLEFYGGEGRAGPPLTFTEIIIAYPNLKQLLIHNLSPTGISNILTEMADAKRRNSAKLNIQKLNIFNGDFSFGQVSSQMAQFLIDLKFPLTHLNLDVGITTSDLTMASMLKTYCTKLRHLTLYRGPFAIPFFKFPFDITFPELITLEIAETVTEDLNFLLFAPKLQKLSICESPESEPPILPTSMIMNTDTIPKVSLLPMYLTTFRLDYDCSLGDVRKLVRWFPKIKSLRMYLNNDSARLVCGEWKDLEELEVLGDKVTDEGITGLSLTSLHCDQFVLTRNELSICNLKYLRVFIMKNYGMSTLISDLSVRHGFTHMGRLHHLELCSNVITDEGWERLHALPNLTYLKPSDGSWESKCRQFEKGS